MRLRFWLGFALAAAIGIGSVALALVVNARESDSFEARQRDEAVRAAHQAQAQAGLSVGQLASAAAFYRSEGAEDQVTQHEFDTIAASLLGPGALSSTGFIAAVPGAQRAAFERSHGVEIRERGPLGELRRAGARQSYYPLRFAAARGLDITLPIGYDVGTDRFRARFLMRAARTGKPAATRVMRLPVGGTGINVFRPVYRDRAPIATAAQRRAALVGFAVGGFRVPSLVGAAEATLPGNVDVALLERTRTVAGPALDREDGAAAQLSIADRGWVLVVHDPDRPGVGLPLLIAVVGLSLAALLAALVLIWSRSERMQELARQASHDALTGVKNRRRFEEELRAELARSHRYGGEGALLMLDLDNFKRVNDTLGHAAGDSVLREVAQILLGRARETDVVARLGGDEFAIVLSRCTRAEAEAIADEVGRAIRAQAGIGNGEGQEGVALSASIGVATFGQGRRLSYDAVLAQADAAMYEAKDSGRDAVRGAA